MGGEGGHVYPPKFSFSLIVAMSTTGDRILDTALSKVCSSTYVIFPPWLETQPGLSGRAT